MFTDQNHPTMLFDSRAPSDSGLHPTSRPFAWPLRSAMSCTTCLRRIMMNRWLVVAYGGDGDLWDNLSFRWLGLILSGWDCALTVHGRGFTSFDVSEDCSCGACFVTTHFVAPLSSNPNHRAIMEVPESFTLFSCFASHPSKALHVYIQCTDTFVQTYYNILYHNIMVLLS